jgi:hypothetical protein
MLHPHKRKTRHPDIEQFWNSEENIRFKLWCSPYASWRKFKKWIVLKVKDSPNHPSKEEDVKKMYDHIFPELKYEADTKALVERGSENIAVFKWDWTDFLSKKEMKDLKNTLPESFPKPTKMIDLNTAKKITYSAEDLREFQKNQE